MPHKWCQQNACLRFLQLLRFHFVLKRHGGVPCRLPRKGFPENGKTCKAITIILKDGPENRPLIS
jgi:hypothetical protein